MLKIIKYIVSFVVIFMVFIFIGELYSFHVGVFENAYTSTTLIKGEDITPDEMFTDIEQAASKHNVGVFAVNKQSDSIQSLTIDVYALDGVEEQIAQYSKINLMKADSMVLGTTALNFHPLRSMQKISKDNLFYMTGEENDIIEFKRSLIGKYAGGFPRAGAKNSETLFNISSIWAIVFSLLLLMTLYEVALQKKEAMVKIILGDSISRIAIKSILMDVVVYCLMFIGLMWVLQNYVNARFFQTLSWTCLLVFLTLNSLVYLTLLLTNYKQDLATKQKAKNVLKMAYVYKCCSIVLTVLVMAGFIVFISDGLQYYRQMDFFEERKEYKYVAMNQKEDDSVNLNENAEIIEDSGPGLLDVDDNLMSRFNRKMLNSGKSFALVDMDDTYDAKGTHYIYGNMSSVDYLKTQITELQDLNLEEKVYYLVPQKYKDNQAVISQLKDEWNYNNLEYNYDIVFYKNSADIVSIHYGFDITSTIKKNPVIILDNLNPQNPRTAFSMPFLAQVIMYNISPQEFNDFLVSEDLQELEGHHLTGVYDNYLHKLKYTNRMTIFSIVLFIILLVLESLIIQTVLRYEYSINASEIILRKIHGESLFRRNKRIVITTGVFGTLSLVAALITNHIFNLFPSVYIIIGVAFVLGIEVLLIGYYVRKMERANIQKILKGGSL